MKFRKGVILPEKFPNEFQMILAYFRNKFFAIFLRRSNHLGSDKLIIEAIC